MEAEGEQCVGDDELQAEKLEVGEQAAHQVTG